MDHHGSYLLWLLVKPVVMFRLPAGELRSMPAASKTSSTVYSMRISLWSLGLRFSFMFLIAFEELMFYGFLVRLSLLRICLGATRQEDAAHRVWH